MEQVAEKGVPFRVRGVAIQVGPLLGGFADDAAGGVAGSAALGFTEHHHATEQGRGVAAGEAGLHPAHAFAALAVVGEMLLGFEGVVPEHFGMEMPGAAVHLEADGLDVDHALEHVQSRAGAEQAAMVTLGPLPGYLLGQPRPGMPAGAGVDAPGFLQSHFPDQVAADFAKSRALHQHVATPEQPDVSLVGGEGHGFRQVLRAGRPGAEPVGGVDEQVAPVGEQPLQQVLGVIGEVRWHGKKGTSCGGCGRLCGKLYVNAENSSFSGRHGSTN